jgi:hypothetical protein
MAIKIKWYNDINEKALYAEFKTEKEMLSFLHDKEIYDYEQVVEMNDDFTCECGNTAREDGFFPCDINGRFVEPTLEWEGSYICARCNNAYATK